MNFDRLIASILIVILSIGFFVQTWRAEHYRHGIETGVQLLIQGDQLLHECVSRLPREERS